jgi:hypothetical protein
VTGAMIGGGGPTIIGTKSYAKPFGDSFERWSRIASFL